MKIEFCLEQCLSMRLDTRDQSKSQKLRAGGTGLVQGSRGCWKGEHM